MHAWRSRLVILAVTTILATTDHDVSADTCPVDCADWIKDDVGCCPRKLPTAKTPGRLTVGVTITGATITIGKRNAGRAPIRPQRLAPGVYQVAVAAHGYHPWIDVVLVRPGERVHLDVELEPRCAPDSVLDEAGRCGPVTCTAPKRDVGGACCWPGQRVGVGSPTCVGAPSACPPGYARGFGTCVAVDDDHDGLRADADRCPLEAEDADGFEDADGCLDLDDDRDGIPDVSDRCRTQAEDHDAFEDADGCPELDNDRDEIPDTQDRCGLEPEDRDRFADEDGCIDPDNDADGIPDGTDMCPAATEDRDGFADHDGCPDPDNDADGMLDASDGCPLVRETANGYLDHDGCADRTPNAHRLLSPRSPMTRHGIGVTLSGISRGTDMPPAPAIAHSIAVLLPRGLEAGLLAQCATDGTPCLATAFAGVSPLELATWRGGYGKGRWIWFAPYIHVLSNLGLGASELGLGVGNRVGAQGRRGTALLVGYETARGPVEGGLRASLEITPDREASGGQFRPRLGLRVIGGMFFGQESPGQGMPNPEGIVPVLTALVTYGGLGVGVTAHGARGTVPAAELALRWLVDPFARMQWYVDEAAPDTTLGFRMPFRLGERASLVLELGYDLGLGPLQHGVITGFGIQVEGKP